MNYSLQELSAQIKLARRKKGISQRALSVKIGVPQSHISKIENGLVDLQTSSLIQLARALDLEVVLVSMSLLPALDAMQNSSQASKAMPAYRLDDEAYHDS